MKFAAFATVVNAGFYAESSLETKFATYMAHFNKQYLTSAEYEARLGFFTKTHAAISEHNNKGLSWQLEHNHMSDWTPEERQSLLGYQRRPRKQTQKLEANDIPETVDWRNLKSVSTIKDQGKCGSCWAFSTTGSIEANTEIQHKEFIPLSEQQLVDCSWWDSGCNGGNIDSGFTYAQKNGLEGEADYPYKAVGAKCAFDKTKVKNDKVIGYLDIEAYNIVQMKAALAHGPVSIAIQANQDIFQHYAQGIIANNGVCGEDLDHAVLAVGYGKQNEIEYFIVKNSWGSSWGDKGYVLLEHNSWSCACGCNDVPSMVKIAP